MVRNWSKYLVRTQTQDEDLTKLAARSGTALNGTISVPGDKSISHRALMIGAVAVGSTKVYGLLESEDVLRTADALRALGVSIDKSGESWVVDGVGVGGLTSPEDVLDLGNSGTAARLLLGLMASHDLKAYVTGDRSLRSRPMDRVIDPLSRCGAVFDFTDEERMPMVVYGAAEPIPIDYDVPVPSAQVKSSILFSGLNTPGTTTVREREATRDHTENMLRAFGAELEIVPVGNGGRYISLHGYAELEAQEISIPGDPSSAAFPGVAALVVPGSEIIIKNVGINPLRAGLFQTLKEMGANIEMNNMRKTVGEPIADMSFRYGPLTGVDVPATRSPSMIDEYPIAAIAAAVASGETRFRGISELRVKESDRFTAIVDGLTACGVPVRSEGDDIVVTGLSGLLPGGAEINVNLDHRIAMTYLVMGLVSEKPVVIDDADVIDTSFPGFLGLMTGLGADIAPFGA
ncbi:MAG: 3-phosphoshikimate 1-carboxyvinyltransferase [Alphaproteobacteria bacterium MarineAlpha11_Bin1]|nr:MAG: 3-phosphoshikimate 1-carboxyvinyltransferase [Alphaproteobacteria bacterium MarineAlpha11_Bin1]|tara:strand:- start:2618 stop:4000 length:1383 start_codon:yes stop_codon:yes gene_type:complete